MMAEEMSAANVQELLEHMEGQPSEDLVTRIRQFGDSINTREGAFPCTLVELEEEGVDNIVARLVMQHVDGSNELVISLHCRKIVCALDMFDWEESGASKKDDIKMAKTSAKAVRNSLMTWLPRGEGRHFQEAVDGPGQAFATKKIGFWGKTKSTINKHYSPKDKKTLVGMLEDISRFYQATKSGGRKTA